MKQSNARATVKPDKITQANLDDTVGAFCESKVEGIVKSRKAIRSRLGAIGDIG